jgi:hypothetical protein
MSFSAWRLIHRIATGTVAALAVAHVALTAMIYDTWSPDALWFLLSGLGLLVLAVMNWAHVGLGPCELPTAPAVRWANVVYVVAGLAALAAVPQPHVFVLVAALITQAAASFSTLRPSPHAHEVEA